VLRAELAGLEKRIRSATNRERKLQRHGYSRLLDLERLLHLIRLLSTWPDLASSDAATAEELEAIVSPLPQGDLADRAAVFLRRLHGDCYGDAAAIRTDLQWLEANGFCSAVPVATPIQLAPMPAREAKGVALGGVPPMGDGPVFLRVMTLLRHLLQVPFDRPVECGAPLHQHLIAATAAIPGAYLPGETATLRKDLEMILTPYGFRNRHDNVRHGYCLGTAVLSPARLQELHNVVRQTAGRLADPSAQDLLAELDERLGWAGISADGLPPVRSYARHAVVDTALVRRDSLAAPRRADAIEAAIVAHHRVLLERYAGVGSFAGSADGELRVWPLQLIFHNVGWYLLYEEDQIGQEQGLIRSERLDRLALRRQDTGFRRSAELHAAALSRLERLLHHSGGIFFGGELDQQLAIASTSAQRRAQVGIREVIAEVRPAAKADTIRSLQAAGEVVAMVGDGVNDAPALATADIGIAIGSGSDVAKEAGDILLLRDDVRDVVTALGLSRATMRRIRQNLFWAFIYNILGVPIAALGWLNPMIAGAAMALSSLSVIVNSALLGRYRKA
jgi:hypothetical protein